MIVHRNVRTPKCSHTVMFVQRNVRTPKCPLPKRPDPHTIPAGPLPPPGFSGTQHTQSQAGHSNEPFPFYRRRRRVMEETVFRRETCRTSRENASRTVVVVASRSSASEILVPPTVAWREASLAFPFMWFTFIQGQPRRTTFLPSVSLFSLLLACFALPLTAKYCLHPAQEFQTVTYPSQSLQVW